MANRQELKLISKARLKSAQELMKVNDWLGAAYMMAWSLECALKSATCKALHLQDYPENTRNKKKDAYFMTHLFDNLKTVSGLEDIFSSRGNVDAFRNWSDFTNELPSDWPSMRYEPGQQWTKIKVEKMYTNLTEANNGILKIISKKKRW